MAKVLKLDLYFDGELDSSFDNLQSLMDVLQYESHIEGIETFRNEYFDDMEVSINVYKPFIGHIINDEEVEFCNIEDFLSSRQMQMLENAMQNEIGEAFENFERNLKRAINAGEESCIHFEMDDNVTCEISFIETSYILNGVSMDAENFKNQIIMAIDAGIYNIEVQTSNIND